ncbi:hypothetical protein FJR11_07570 [Anabaena sp. UHCC 0187]|uniref:hypothetical protein n=1 Tax=Anabaena sp. UHCC 0187 TaxID=2590018 RepID=UPI0014455EC9|nr:hypothetical protein [Anabaena sp. UHCC 0187]MDP5016979.1 hypothetical protein [Dolichospermum sp.]MTJ12454.1 hypothetical protein [Anabaena sp. UHCC 0187]
MRLKRWESPRREGRNDKGRGGSARKRQLKKQRQMLRQKLKENQKPNDHHKNHQGESSTSPYFLAVFSETPPVPCFQPLFIDQ